MASTAQILANQKNALLSTGPKTPEGKSAAARNSIKHGLARKVGGGRITIRTAARDGCTVIEVHDDGLGMTEERLEHALEDGIGLSNVNERLRTIYGPPYHLKLTSVPGQGTCVSVEIPEIALPERVTA